MEYAGFWMRFGALIIDWLILGVIGFVITMILGITIGVPTALFSGLIPISDVVAQTADSGASTASFGIVGWLYYALMESSEHQATVGKKVLGLKVVDEQGARISFLRATGRYLGKWVSSLILGLGYIMAAFTAKKQALHDFMASCLVIRS